MIKKYLLYNTVLLNQVIVSFCLFFITNIFAFSPDFNKKLQELYSDPFSFNIKRTGNVVEKKILRILYDFNETRYGSELDFELFDKLTDETLELLSKKYEENELPDKLYNELCGIIYGFKAYLEKENSFYGPVKNGMKAHDYLKDSYEKYKSEVGYLSLTLADVYKVLFFQDSYTVSLLSDGFHKGKAVNKLLKILEDEVQTKSYFQVELQLLLIEIYAEILKLPAYSIKFSKELCEKYPFNSYFRYLYVKDLFSTSDYTECYKETITLFYNNKAKKVYPFLIKALLYRYECAQTLNNEDKNAFKFIKELDLESYITYFNGDFTNSDLFLDDNMIIRKSYQKFKTADYYALRRNSQKPEEIKILELKLLLQNSFLKKAKSVPENFKLIETELREFDYFSEISIYNKLILNYNKGKFSEAYDFLKNIELDNYSDKHRLNVWKNILDSILEDK